MIRLTTLDDRELLINAELIERVECVPETVVTLTNNKRILVRESLEEIRRKVVCYRREIQRKNREREQAKCEN